MGSATLALPILCLVCLRLPYPAFTRGMRILCSEPFSPRPSPCLLVSLQELGDQHEMISSLRESLAAAAEAQAAAEAAAARAATEAEEARQSAAAAAAGEAAARDEELKKFKLQLVKAKKLRAADAER